MLKKKKALLFTLSHSALFAVAIFCVRCDDDIFRASGEQLTDYVDLSAPPLMPDRTDNEAVVAHKMWHLIGNDVTPGDRVLDSTVRPPEGAVFVDAWIDGRYVGRYYVEDGIARIDASLDSVDVGTHTLLVSADENETAFAALDFIRSHPFYIFVTNDWDDSDNEKYQYELQERLHDGHPHLVMTHFVGPYTFTDPNVSQIRREFNVEWLHGMRDDYGDEIGLHIHPYCNFVNTTSLTCRTEPTFGLQNRDSSGYTVMLSSYSQQETETLLDRALEIFEEYELGVPTTFRAGGWTAEIHTLEALASRGFQADTSANNWSRIEEWQKYSADLYPWNKEAWATINDTSQPYYPSTTDILSSDIPTVDILEVPDNGSLADYVTAREMVEIFQVNWQGGPLDDSKSLVIGYHPPTLDYRDFFVRIDGALEHIDQYLHTNDDGPVIYEIMRNAPRIWPKN